MCKMLYILIFSTLLFSCSDSENLDSTNSGNQDPKAKEKGDLLRLAIVQIGDKWGYINYEGEVVIKPQFDNAEPFSEGLAAVKIGYKWGYVNQGGGVVIKPQFGEAKSFSKGWASVRIDSSFRGGSSSKYGAINREGKFFLGVKYFSEGLSPAKIDGNWGYINQVGEIVIEPQFDDAGHFSEGLGRWPAVEGLAGVRIGYKWGYINREGEFFSNEVSFSEGLARVRIGNKWGYINQISEIVIKPQFDDAGDFSEGLSPVKIGGKYGYINQIGEIVIKPQFDDAGIFLK